MIPDKIYVTRTDMGDVYTLDANSFPNGGEQYIRKDALLEWLEYEKEWFGGTDIEPHYQKVIDKLNSM